MKTQFFDESFENRCVRKENDPLSTASISNELNKHFSIIPLNAKSKIPIETNWSQFCVQKRPYEQSDFDNRNIGIACGKASNLMVLDVDDMEKFAKFIGNNKYNQDYAETLIIQTGSGLFHFYFKYPNDKIPYKSRSYKDFGFDIRADGGQVVAPGSIHPDTGRPYTVFKNIEMSDAPQWVLKHSSEKVCYVDSNCAESLSIDLNMLSISDRCKQNIMHKFEKGSRSEVVMSVLIELVEKQISNNTIHSIFKDQRFHIGDKYREKGIHADRYLASEILKAENFVNSKNSNFSNCDSSSTFDLMSIGQIAAMNPELKYVVDGLWSLNDTLLIFGNGGSGKSLLALQLAIALAYPTEIGFLGVFKVKEQRKVLFLQSEVSAAGINDRLKKIFSERGMPQAVKDNIKFVSIDGDITIAETLTDSKFMTKLKNTIISNSFDVMVIDPLISYHEEDENSNNAMRKVLDGVKKLCQELKISILIVHHSGKSYQGENNSGGRGASSIGDWASSSVELKADSKDQYFSLIHKKARDFSKFNMLKLMRSENLLYSVVNNEECGYDYSVFTVLKAMQNISKDCIQKDLYTEIMRIVDSNEDSNSISKNTAISWIDKAIKFCAITRDEKTKLYSLCK